MEKIAAKQVDGVVDLSSTQVIPGRKQFDGGVGSSQGQTGHYPLIVAGFLYWVLDPNGAVQEGDFRLGVSPSTGMVALQKLTGGVWGNVSPPYYCLKIIKRVRLSCYTLFCF